MNQSNKIEMDFKTKILLNIYLKYKNITIIDILRNSGFDTNIPNKLYIGKSPKGNNELIYEYKKKKYNICLYLDGYIEIIKYSYYNNEKDRQYDSYSLYKINKNAFKKSTIKTIHLEINTNAYYKKNENGELIETTYEDGDFYFSHQEVYWGEKMIWAIRVMSNDSYPYHIELKYNPLNNGKMPDIKIDIIKLKLKEYFATININTPIIEILKKICEINSITLNELNNGYLSFGISKNNENNQEKYLLFKDGVIEVFENNETTTYIKEGDDYVQKT